MEINKIEYKKPFYPVREPLQEHLTEYSLSTDLPITYDDLLHYRDLIPVVDADGNPTLWYSVLYDNTDLEHFRRELTAMYQMLAGSGNSNPFLKIASIEFCSFGNSKPFRIKVINVINDIYDFYYIKRPDSSRVYGLELEEIFSPNKVSFLVGEGILLEQHIIGIPCDDFVQKNPGLDIENRARFAKEFVKFNERCFARLLGDMRAYNFVVEIIQDFDNVQYRLRAIDFDQQCYEGRRSIYLPQFYKENLELVKMAQSLLSKDVADQYISEERLAMRKRFLANQSRTRSILNCMKDDILSTPENTDLLRTELAKYHNNNSFYQCDTMGKVLCLHLENLLGIRILNFLG